MLSNYSLRPSLKTRKTLSDTALADDGINKIRKGFEEAGMEMPIFKEEECGLTVTFNRKKTVGSDFDIPKYHLSTVQVQNLWDSMEDGRYYSVSELMILVNILNRRYFTKIYISPALKDGIIEFLYPNQPRHPKQKYRRKQNG